MSTIRFKALEIAQNRPAVTVQAPASKHSDYYGTHVFGNTAMKAYLSREAYDAIQAAIHKGSTIDRKIADQVAAGMKQWAMAKGVMHYTHWFQPLTGQTAEKHDTFFEPIDSSTAMEKFSGSALVQQEPDASSFPNGGLRNTFEARGYTAWDPSSPAFIMESTGGNTLCIPTIFVSYTGEALDYKAPLLKALHFMETSAVEVCQYFDKNVTKITASLGIEQEYFLVDEALYYARPDLAIAGRTLFGHGSAKGQQLEDHYFGSIPSRVQAFMLDLEIESVKLGIPLKTRHNEVAPSQFECAPMFEEANLAIDHNQLLMDLMDKVGKKHKFHVLLHEKPYAGINGSGKHNNWSMITNTGVNLLSPGNTPAQNLQFLTFFINTIKAVHDHADLMRASIASAGNEHRLGANEAPPAIMSIFIGTQLSKVLDDFVSAKATGKATGNEDKKIIFPKIPDIQVDNTDRNRTSPFAFTGNKFEFRAVGSSANSASAMIVLNSIVAYQLKAFRKEVDALAKKGKKKEEAIVEVLKGYVKSSRKILFEGNGYSEEWVKEAARRGLSNIRTCPEALDAYVSKQSRAVFVDNNIFTDRELEARHEILLEIYTKKIQIESRVIGDLANTMIIPSAVAYQQQLADNVGSLKDLDLPKSAYQTQLGIIKDISEHISILKKSVDEMVEERKIANNLGDTHKAALHYCHKVRAYFEPIRYQVDKLERIIDNNLWELPKYRELLFLK